MPESLRHVPPESVITGWDFSTGAVKCLAFDLQGNTLAQVRLPTDLWTEGGVSELNLMQLEGQARASVRAMASRLRALGRLQHWVAGGISATHHTAGRIDAEEALAASLLDELFEIERWGRDVETERRHAVLRRDLGAAATFLCALAAGRA